MKRLSLIIVATSLTQGVLWPTKAHEFDWDGKINDPKTDLSQISQNQSFHASASPSDNIVQPPDLRDAISIVQGSTEDGILSSEQIQEALREIAAIKQRFSEVADIHSMNSQVSHDRITLKPTKAIQARLQLDVQEALAGKPSTMQIASESQDKDGRVKNYVLSQAGLPGFDELNKGLPVLKVTLQIETYYRSEPDASLIVDYYAPIDANTLAKIYKSYGHFKYVYPWITNTTDLDDNSYIYRFRKKEEGLNQYVFFRKDLNSQCFECGKYYYFNLRKSGTSYQIDKVTSDNPYIAVFGLPDRFPVRAFSNLDEVLQAGRSRDWWIRLHAVHVLARLLESPNSEWVGEDRDAPNLKKISQEVQGRKDEVTVFLVHAFKNDKDEQVREAAGEFFNPPKR